MRRIIISVSILLTLFISGCWDRIELEENAYVAAIGVDLREDGRMSVTYLIQNPQVGSSDIAKASNEPASEIVTLDAADILSTRDTTGANVARKIILSQAEVIVLGEEYAKSESCFQNLSELLREREIKSDVKIIVSREKASEFLRNNKPPIETRPMKFYDLMSKRWKETGLSPLADLHTFVQLTERDQDLFLAIYVTSKHDYKKDFKEEDRYLPGEITLQSDNPVQFIGSAVFKEGKMIGSMTGEETRIVWHIRPESRFSGINVTYKDPLDERFSVSALLYKTKSPQIRVDVNGEKPRVDVKLELGYDITCIPSHIDYVEDLEKQEILRKSIEAQFENKTLALIERTQKEFKADPFNWGPIVASKFLTYQELRKFDWMKKYPEAEIRFDIEVKLKGFGKELKPSNLNKIRD